MYSRCLLTWLEGLQETHALMYFLLAVMPHDEARENVGDEIIIAGRCMYDTVKNMKKPASSTADWTSPKWQWSIYPGIPTQKSFNYI